MDWVFFPVNFMFNLAPIIFTVVGAVVGISLALYTWGSFVIATAVAAETEDELSSKLLHREVSANKRRIQKNLALLLLYVYTIGGAFTGSLPKNTIPTRDGAASNANTAYLKSLDRTEVDRGPQAIDHTRVPFHEFDGWDEEAAEQDERIKAALP